MTQKETNRLHLQRLFPVLQKDYRKLDKKELKNPETLKQLFGDAEKDFDKLTLIYKYQSLI
jgi:hypothetical protein